MPLILSVDYDRRQAGALASLVRDRLHAELVQAASARDGFDALAGRVPDLILTPHLLSPKDESLISARLRDLGPAAAHVQTLTTPVLRAPSKRETPARSRGVLASLRRDRRRRAADAPAEGCDPEEFAEQVRQYLETAADQKRAIDESARQPDLDAESGHTAGTAEPSSWPEAASTDDAATEPVPDAPPTYAYSGAHDGPAADEASVPLSQTLSAPGDHPLDVAAENVAASEPWALIDDAGVASGDAPYAPGETILDAARAGDATEPVAHDVETTWDVAHGSPAALVESAEPEEAPAGADACDAAPGAASHPRAARGEDSAFGALYTDTPADEAWASRTTQPIDALAIPAIPGEAPVPVVDLMAYGDLDAIAQGFAAPEAASFEIAFGADRRDHSAGGGAKARRGDHALDPPQPEAEAPGTPTSTPAACDAETQVSTADDLAWSAAAPVADAVPAADMALTGRPYDAIDAASAVDTSPDGADGGFVLVPGPMDAITRVGAVEDADAGVPARCVYTWALPLVAAEAVSTPEIEWSSPASTPEGLQIAAGDTAATGETGTTQPIIDAAGAGEEVFAIEALAIAEPEIKATAVTVATPEASTAPVGGSAVEDASLDPDDVIEISLDDLEEAPGARVAWAQAISAQRAAEAHAGSLDVARETPESDPVALPPSAEDLPVVTPVATGAETAQPATPMAYVAAETPAPPVATGPPATSETEAQAFDDDATSAAAIRASYRRFDRHRQAPPPDATAAPADPGVPAAPDAESRAVDSAAGSAADAPAAAVPAGTRRGKAARTKGPVVHGEAVPPGAPDTTAAASEDAREPEARTRRERRVRQAKKSPARTATPPHEPASPVEGQTASAAHDTTSPTDPTPPDASRGGRATRPDVPLEVIADFMTGIDEALTAPPAPAQEDAHPASPAVLDDEALSMIGDAALKLLDTPILKEFWLGLTGDEPEPEAAAPPPEVVAAVQPAPEPEAAPEAIDTAVSVAAPAPPPPAPPAPVVPPLVTEPERPAEDEWGIFDPSQAGFAALAERLDAKAAAAGGRKRAR